MHGMKLKLKRLDLGLSVKTIDEAQRYITGIATSPSVDRVGDSIDPFGVKSAPTIPLLMHHDHQLIVGRAKLGRPTARGIPFEAWLAKIADPGPVRDRADEAWTMVQHGLLTSVSIGFIPDANKSKRMDNGGTKFGGVEVIELSLTATPANAEAVIENFKALRRPVATVTLTSDFELTIVTPEGLPSTEVTIALNPIAARNLARGILEYANLDAKSVTRSHPDSITLAGYDTTPRPVARPRKTTKLADPKPGVVRLGKTVAR